MTVHPARLARDAPTLTLLAAWGAQHPLGFVRDDCGTRTLCPRCRHVDYNGPTLEVFTAALMRCWRCGHETNRAGLERRVLERPQLLEALAMELLVSA